MKSGFFFLLVCQRAKRTAVSAPQKNEGIPEGGAGTPRLTASARAEMTLPRVVRDLLMLAPSWGGRGGGGRLGRALGESPPLSVGCRALLTLSRTPLAPEASARSLPARSTRLMRLTWGGRGIWGDLGGNSGGKWGCEGV